MIENAMTTRPSVVRCTNCGCLVDVNEDFDRCDCEDPDLSDLDRENMDEDDVDLHDWETDGGATDSAAVDFDEEDEGSF